MHLVVSEDVYCSHSAELSIPFTWDFSMHLVVSEDVYCSHSAELSIPFTWDFSMHLFQPLRI